MKNLKNVCVISARGGSKGLPNKNIKVLIDKPLIAWSIEQALETPEIEKVVVCTDSIDIKKIAEDYGALVPFNRPSEISRSETPKFEVFKYALEKCEEVFCEKYDAFVDLDCTNPLRTSKDISNCIQMFHDRKKNNVDGVFTICKSRKNPYFNMLEKDDNGALKISKKLENIIVRRQDAPEIFDHVASIYVLDPDYVRSAKNLLDGYTEGYDIGIEKSYDIDSNYDFQLIELLIKNKLVK